MYGQGTIRFKDASGPTQQGLIAEIYHENSFVSGQPVSLRTDDGTTYLLLRAGLLGANIHTLYLYTINTEIREDGAYDCHGITEFPTTNLTAPRTAELMKKHLEKLAAKRKIEKSP